MRPHSTIRQPKDQREIEALYSAQDGREDSLRNNSAQDYSHSTRDVIPFLTNFRIGCPLTRVKSHERNLKDEIALQYSEEEVLLEVEFILANSVPARGPSVLL